MKTEEVLEKKPQCGDKVLLDGKKEPFVCQMVLRNRLKGEIIYVLKSEHEQLEVKGPIP